MTGGSVSTWFWVASAIFILWNLIGIAACATQLGMSEAKMATLPPAQRDAWIAQPVWVKLAYIIATLSGLAGAVLLIFRSGHALAAFWVSLVAVVLQFGWVFLIYGGMKKFGGPKSAIFPAFIIAMAVVQILVTMCAAKQGWLH